MGTSLADQLRKLSVPQTSAFSQEKKRASLLFDPKEAAGIDRGTIYEIGLKGFEELKKFNSKFDKFATTLFDLSSQSLERSVESEKANKKLNKHIRSFILLLSPYFLLKPAHQALEWLINRFHIHLYNRDDLLLLIFPYHDTRMFVRVLQLLDVKSKSSPWHWLRPLQKPGVPLSKTALLNHCAVDPSFLKFVCDGALAAVKEHSGDAHCLTTALGFFCTTIVGALEHTSATTELQLVHILKPLLKGLPSPVLDFAAASFMITAQLADKAQLSENVLHQIIVNLTKNPQASLDLEKVLLLVLLYQSQSSTLTSFPHKALLRLASVPKFPTTLGELSASGGHVTPLLVPLLAETLRSIQSQIDDTGLRKLAINLVSQVGLEEDSVEEIIRMAVENFDINGLLGEQPDPVEQVSNNSKEIIEWYTMFMRSLERKYPTQYDKVIHKMYASKKTRNLLEKILGFHNSDNIFEKLNHPNSKIRGQAVQYVVSNFYQIEEKEKQSIKHTLSARLRDDKMSVVSKLLELPLPELVSLLGLDVVLEQLLWLASKCCKSSSVSTKVQVQVLKCLCSSDLSQPGLIEDRILLAVLPYLFPLDDLDLLCTLEVLQSEFAQQNHMLMLVKKDLGDLQRVKNPAQVNSAVWRGLTPACLPNKHLWEAIDQAPHLEGDFSPHLLAITLLSRVVPENDPHTSLMVLNKAIKCVEDSHMYVEQNVPNVTEETFPVLLGDARMGRLAVPGFINCLTRLMHKTPLPEHLKKTMWWNLAKNVVTSDDAAMLFVTRLFEVLITGCSLENLIMKRLYVDALKEFNDVYFPSLKEQVQFLYKLTVGSEMTPTSLVVNPELRLRALRLTAALLQKTSEPLGWCLDWSDCALIPSLLIVLAYPLAPFRMTALDCLTSVGRLFGSALTSDNWGPLVTVLLSRREELIMDHKHIYLVMYQYLSSHTQEAEIEQLKPNMESCLKTLLKLIVDVETPPYISAALLKILKRVNSESVLMNLVPLGLRVLSISQQMDRELDVNHSIILRNVLGKLEQTTSDCLKHDKCWELVESALKDSHTVVWADNGTPTCPAIVTLTQLSQVPLEHLPSKLQQKLVTLLIEISTDTDLADVLSACRHFMKKIFLDASIVVEELTKMRDVQGNEITPTGRSKRLRRSVNLAPSLSLLQSPTWKRGVTMLEFVQNKKKLNSVHLMLPVLFDILKKSLEFETQAPVEYTKQLVLSSILNCCQKLSPEGEPIDSDLFVPERTFNVELIVHCIRATQNPQTHHHALLVLAHLAGMIPEQVLHNMMSIFTFMGYSVLRHDDAFSFQVISKIMETIIPVLIKASQSDKISSVGDHELTCTIARVLSVFTVALLDIPEHRRLPLFYKLLSTVDPDRSLWLLLCLVVESHVSCWAEGDLPKGHSKDETPKRLEFCLSLAAMFPVDTVMRSCISLMDKKELERFREGQSNILLYNILEHRNRGEEEACQGQLFMSISLSFVSNLTKSWCCDCVISEQMKKNSHPVSEVLFNIEKHTAKQLRHFKYTLTSFLSSLLSLPALVNQGGDVQVLLKHLREMIALSQWQRHKLSIFIVGGLRVMEGDPSWRELLQCWVCHLVLLLVKLVILKDVFKPQVPDIDQKIAALSDVDTHLMEPLYISMIELMLKFISRVSREVGRNANQPSAKYWKIMLNQSCDILDKVNCLLPGDMVIPVVRRLLDNKLSTVRRKTMELLNNHLQHQADLSSKCDPESYFNLLPPLMAVVGSIGAGDKGQEGELELNQQTALLSLKLMARFLGLEHPTRFQECVDVMAKMLKNNVPQGNVLASMVLCIADMTTSLKANIIVSIPLIMPALINILRKHQTLESPSLMMLSIITAVHKIVENLTKFLSPYIHNVLREICTLSAKWVNDTDPKIAPIVHKLQLTREKISTSLSPRVLVPAVSTCFTQLLRNGQHAAIGPLLHILSDSFTAMSPEERVHHQPYLITFFLEALQFRTDSSEGLEAVALVEGHIVDALVALVLKLSESSFRPLYFKLFHWATSRTRLSSSIAEHLKGLFVLFAGHFLKNAAGLLDANNLAKTDTLYFGSGKLAKTKANLLLQQILKTLHGVFMYDRQKFINKERFDVLMQPIVDQVRLAALQTLCEVAHKLGEDFLPFLPETVPFLAERLEDEEEEVEKEAKRVVQELEEVLGESLQKYF
uniref:HEAT repeat-containing protein 1 n=1 Tax=Timema bartmani TaxID=61472 RepID=A0A7R9HZF3_9NEOP|nr:unnamed protein product [Timema bartmani]